MTTLYLSQLWLNARSREAWRDLADCQGLHRTLMRAFPDGIGSDGEGARAQAGLLFRPETDRRTGTVRILAQSTSMPDWRALPAGYVAPASACPDGWSTRTVPEGVWNTEAGARRRFRLRANVTAKVFGNRVPLRTEAGQLAWLLSHATAAGFRVTLPPPGEVLKDGHREAKRSHDLLGVVPVDGLPPVRIDRDTPVSGLRPGEAGGAGAGTSVGARPPRARLSFEGVVFEGILEISDPERFATAVRQGVGPAKAYGSGLLSVAPA